MIPTDLADVAQEISTGALPNWHRVEELVVAAHSRFVGIEAGVVADYIPVLGAVDPTLFGVSVIDALGGTHDAGDALHPFSIQSISKMFVCALALQEHGHERVRDVVGVNNTGMPFNSVMALELNGGHPMNPMVNAGAIVTTSLISGDTAEDKWERIHAGLSAFAGRQLELEEEVYRSESETNERNQGLGHLLSSYGRLEGNSEEIVDIYTRQCSLNVTTHDLAMMGATLADGGVNPVTGERVVSAEVCRDTLAIVATSGLYERSGNWLFEIGIPAKSGVSGGIIAVAPGKGAAGAFSPRLDGAGNSVRAQMAVGYLSRALGMNLFASAPLTGPVP
ncbi:glutaminase A [Microbacterium sp. A93]|uniref:glutaminase A n=1 Tax=unclassified Microbacterium TaxID=2609290 RepID=UPI003F431B28